MKSIQILHEKRTGRDKFKEFNIARYAKMNFGMFGGEPINVRIAFKNEMAGVFIDRFGRDIMISSSKTQKGWSEIAVDVTMSDQFLGWIFALGTSVKIMGPDAVVRQFREEMEALKKLYK